MKSKLFALFIATIAGEALAESPFELDFILKPYQIESSTQVSYLKSTYDINSIVFKNNNYSEFVNYSQGFSIGLPNNFSVGITEIYADPVHKNPLNPGEGKSELKSPFFSLIKLIELSEDVSLKASGIIQPNLTGTSAAFNTAQFNMLAIKKTQKDFDLALGYSFMRYELAQTNSNSLDFIALKRFSEDTLLNLGYKVTFWDATQTTAGNFQASTGHTISGEISTRIAPSVWAALNSNYYVNKATFDPVPLPYSPPLPPYSYTNTTNSYSVGATIKWLF